MVMGRPVRYSSSSHQFHYFSFLVHVPDPACSVHQGGLIGVSAGRSSWYKGRNPLRACSEDWGLAAVVSRPIGVLLRARPHVGLTMFRLVYLNKTNFAICMVFAYVCLICALLRD